MNITGTSKFVTFDEMFRTEDMFRLCYKLQPNISGTIERTGMAHPQASTLFIYLF